MTKLRSNSQEGLRREVTELAEVTAELACVDSPVTEGSWEALQPAVVPELTCVDSPVTEGSWDALHPVVAPELTFVGSPVAEGSWDALAVTLRSISGGCKDSRAV